jgi:hypothetical protein
MWRSGPITKASRLACLPLALAAAACSGGSDDGVEHNPSALTGCEAIALEQPEDGLQLEIPLAVPPGSEAEYCQLVLVEQPINLNWSDGLFTHGSHHALVHKTSYRNEIPTRTIVGQLVESDQPHPCLTPAALWDVEGVIAAGRSVEHPEFAAGVEKGVLPDDVAFRVEAGEVLLVNFHMINTTNSDIDSCFKINLHGIPDAQVQQEAGTLFFYNPAVAVPANGSTTARMACEIAQDITVINAV